MHKPTDETAKFCAMNLNELMNEIEISFKNRSNNRVIIKRSGTLWRRLRTTQPQCVAFKRVFGEFQSSRFGRSRWCALKNQIIATRFSREFSDFHASSGLSPKREAFWPRSRIFAWNIMFSYQLKPFLWPRSLDVFRNVAELDCMFALSFSLLSKQ